MGCPKRFWRLNFQAGVPRNVACTRLGRNPGSRRPESRKAGVWGPSGVLVCPRRALFDMDQCRGRGLALKSPPHPDRHHGRSLSRGEPPRSPYPITPRLTPDSRGCSIILGADSTGMGGTRPVSAGFLCPHCRGSAEYKTRKGNKAGATYAALSAPGASDDRWHGPIGQA